MKFSKILLSIIAFVYCTNVMGQTPIELHINHFLGGITPFSFNKTTQNDLGHNFQVSRLEYYISKISITHDGGTVTDVPSHYILVDAKNNTVDQLGSFNITNVESISFHIGVDSPANNADPSAQPNGHPLAPKSPSMHWGWASGYRFVAFEGKSGSSLNQDLQVHSLFNKYYYKQTVNVSSVTQGGKLIIALNADYAQALKGISISSGLFSHGLEGEDVTLLNNFRDNVFKAGHPVSVKNIAENNINLKVYPNPSTGDITIGYDQDAALTIYNLQGQIVQQLEISKGTTRLQIRNSGVYLLKLSANNNIVVKKVEVL